ncbi:MBL fold metallo-hydrolase [Oscillibacter sp.]|uniref:MBL fold metallo-hydrolase n=1 Tax=Oscillibacter sp. TaxID=1945593 RepID=UPI002636BB78|nr:MBL fold metallo-hydrolase [Oscillibacter sp.]MDD3347446.1 MBL fold metallo-hydrolase [Oscillibacter sp.]
MNFPEAVEGQAVKPGQAAVFWLGQAGFLIKTAGGRKIAIDPYLSNCVQRLIPEEGDGFKRLMPPPCEAKELDLDVLLISHEHNDHFDVDAIGDLVREKTQVYTNCVVAAQMEEMGFAADQIHVLHKGQAEALGECTLLPVDCDHGELAPEALGFLLDFGFGRLYYAGDTALTLSRLAVPLAMRPEVAILPINGAFGNLNGVEAARYAGLLGCRVCIPCHFWTFPLHHGDPQQIIESIGALAPRCRVQMLCQGEGCLVGGEAP